MSLITSSKQIAETYRRIRKLNLLNVGANPAAAGDVSRNGGIIFFHDGSLVRQVPLMDNTGLSSGNVLIHDGTIFNPASLAKDLTLAANGDATLSDAMRTQRANLLLNPSFDTVLYGTHTSAGFRTTSVSANKNTPIPGWRLWTPAGGSPSYDFEHVIGAIDSRTGRFGRITVNTLANGGGVRQEWSATEYLTSMLEQLKGRYANFAIDLRNSHNSVSCRPFIYFDGTGGGFVYGTAVTGSTAWTRSFIASSIVVPQDATYLYFGVEVTAVNAGGDTVHCDHGSVLATTTPLAALPFVPRPPANIVSPQLKNTAGTFEFVWSTPSANNTVFQTAGGETDTDPVLNNLRPHWANVMGFNLNLVGGASIKGQYFAIFPGSTLIYDNYCTQPSDSAIDYTVARDVELGINGEVGYLTTYTGLAVNIQVQQWKGFNL